MDQSTFAKLNAFWEVHGDADAWSIITIGLHNGDLYQFLTLLRQFRVFRGGGRRIRVLAVTRPHFEVASLFSHVLDEVLLTPDVSFGGRELIAWREARSEFSFEPGVLMNVYPVDYIPSSLQPGAFWMPFHNLQWAWTLLFAYLIRIPLFLGRDAPHISESARYAAAATFEGLGLPPGRTLILFPYAQTVMFRQSQPHVRAHFSELARRAAAAGLSVCTSTVGTEEPIEGTLRVFLPFAELIPFCELAGHVVVVRSGISDLLATARCRKINIYPNARDADEFSPIAYGLGGAETNIGFDFLRQDNPESFADTVTMELQRSAQGDARTFVPRQVLDLLALPTGDVGLTGRFRQDDFMVRNDFYRVCRSGVLGEGWSGLEPWGVWSIGCRSVLYLRPATELLKDLPDSDDVKVVLRLELGFAIAPETHDTLRYAIQVNSDEPIRYQARWPDGQQSHWPEGRWRTLQFPLSREAINSAVRIIFIVENPVSTRTLSGGQAGDDRVLAIELMQATYDVIGT